MPTTEPTGGSPLQVQQAFTGLNAVDPPHLLADGEVAAATNIDFTLEPGGMAVRRGTIKKYNVSTGAQTDNLLTVNFPSISYGAVSDTDGIAYVSQGAVVYRAISGTATAIGTSTATAGANWVSTIYKGFTYLGGGNGFGTFNHIKDDGTTATDWIKQSPAAAPAITVNTLAAQNIGTTNSAAEGTLAAGTYTCDATSFRLEIDVGGISGTAGLGSIGTHTIGDYGFITLRGAISEPKNVTRMIMDFGIGGFTDYYHTELDLTAGTSAYPDPHKLIDSQLNLPKIIQGTTTITNRNVDAATRANMHATVRQNFRPVQSRISAAGKLTNSSWVVAKPNFEPIFTSPNPGDWTAVTTARLIFEGTGTFSATFAAFTVNGAQDYPLNDIDNGYSWWETWATIDANTGAILGESAPGPAAARTKMQNANVTLVSTGTPTGAHGITHRIFYRQGGYLADAYAVSTVALATSTVTDSMTDIEALALNLPMLTNIQTIPEFSPTPRALVTWYDRIFMLASNTLAWSLPGRPDAFPRTNNVTIGEGGDIGMGLVVWPPGLIIINDHSVWEMVGNYFEGPQTDYTLTKSGSKHGSKSRLTAIRTPYGIPLMDYDGIYMYIPGQGIDEPLDWVMKKIGDMWRGNGATDPANYKGNRIPAIAVNNIRYSCGAFADNVLYIGVPTDAGHTHCDTLIVINFRYKTVNVFQYPWQFDNLFWDQYKSQLLCLTASGNIMQLETGQVDTLDNGSTQNITWSAKTKSWPAPADILMENISIQYRGGTSTVTGVYDQTNTTTIATLTNTNKGWTIPKLGGTISNDISFAFGGTQVGTQNVIYNIQWDSWVHPRRVNFYRTDYWDGGHQGEKIWDVHYTDAAIIASGTVLATAFVDHVAVATFTLSGDNTNEKKRFEFAYPAETYGNIEYTIYNGQSNATFKLFDHTNAARPEPPRVLSFVSDRVSGGEVWFKEALSDVNPYGGTMTGVIFVDDVVISTFTMFNAASNSAGIGRTTFPTPFPTETYGKAVHIAYTGTVPFKHYHTWYIEEPQPDRMTFAESSHETQPSIGCIMTWLAEVNPLGGTCTGTVKLDGVTLMTATFTGTNRNIFEVGTPNITTGKTLQVQYSSTTPFKYWRTAFEIEPKPYTKTTWMVNYKKLGGASQLDFARFWSFNVSGPIDDHDISTGTSTITATWIADGTAVLTNTFAVGTRTYIDRISFPPGIRGYQFRCLMTGDKPFRVYNANIDVDITGVKGFSRKTLPGTPEMQQSTKEVQGAQHQTKPWQANYY